jgi:hypothetical protein
MLEEICRELNNWFDSNPNDGTKNHYFGTFVIEDGNIDLSETDIQPSQYFRIIGSVFNDGVYQYPATGLTDETFDGAVWAMAVPPSVIALSAEIEAWQEKYGGVDSTAMSPYTSESFGGYSYSKSRGGSGNGSVDAGSGTWQSAFANRLYKWRKIRAI